MSQPYPPAQPRPRVPRWKIFTAIVTLLVLIPLVLLMAENWMGARAWEDYVARARAAHEPLTPGDLLPPRVPDDQDIAAIPLLRPLTDFHREPPQANELWGKVVWHNQAGIDRLKDLKPLHSVKLPTASSWWRGEYTDLAALDKAIHGAAKRGTPAVEGPPGSELRAHLRQFDGIIEELRAGGARPASQFLRESDAGADLQLTFTTPLLSLNKILRHRALAELAQGDTEAGARDLVLGFRVAECTTPTPLLIAQLVGAANLELMFAPLWEGLSRHQWSEAQLAHLEHALARFDLVRDFRNGLYGERVIFAWPTLDALKRQPAQLETIGLTSPDTATHIALSLLPEGIFDFNKVTLGDYFGRLARTADPAAHRFFIKDAANLEKELQHERGERPYNPHTFAKHMLGASVSNAQPRGAQAQATLDLARCAIALERYRLKSGGLPDSLAALAPEFLTAPCDVVTGAPLHYRRLEGDAFLLYCVGGNEIDDHGTPGWKKAAPKVPDFMEGDLVWPQPKP